MWWRAFHESSNEFRGEEYVFPYGVLERKADVKKLDSSLCVFFLPSSPFPLSLADYSRQKTNILSKSYGNKHDYSSRAQVNFWNIFPCTINR